MVFGVLFPGLGRLALAAVLFDEFQRGVVFRGVFEFLDRRCALGLVFFEARCEGVDAEVVVCRNDGAKGVDSTNPLVKRITEKTGTYDTGPPARPVHSYAPRLR